MHFSHFHWTSLWHKLVPTSHPISQYSRTSCSSNYNMLEIFADRFGLLLSSVYVSHHRDMRKNNILSCPNCPSRATLYRRASENNSYTYKVRLGQSRDGMGRRSIVESNNTRFPYPHNIYMYVSGSHNRCDKMGSWHNICHSFSLRDCPVYALRDSPVLVVHHGLVHRVRLVQAPEAEG